MLKSTGSKTLFGALIAALATAALVLGTSGGAVATPPYNTGTTTTTSATGNPPVAQYGSRPTVTASVAPTGTSAGAPQGTVTFVVTDQTFGTANYSQTVALTPGPNNTSTATYQFPVTAPASRTYQIVATFNPSNPNLYNSSSGTAYVTMTRRPTTTTITQNNSTSSALVSSSGAPSGVAAPTGTFTFTYTGCNNSGDATKTSTVSAGTDPGTGTGSASRGPGCKLASVSYSGDVNYAPSSANNSGGS